ncbi:bifunctional homocysteine S-methyltransferase/methylenetetrahydrofolate reductase [Anaerocolumna sp. AGMB13020]|uniref:bifunctional homocysteine S-methyltransferase/methylenetetrahydrofolate reductase n=1 Tax=Anaerocolumna sp. AGMB13020 TaxID=3081750 RepID=UPI0029551E5D|nr:bifunctional homocysteine S-methyltransferase/methylenetetrahydrofolate reductase [Anaerocolumna sp. AGMB13020]WOO35718.1 bifunctional homocysteine S-methyltransferase/methylenetetrahydrofolate reductase [Anaerocolumna sp. AGMB13020]
MELRDYLKEHKLITDGAMGTYYSRLLNNDNAVSEYGNIKKEDIIVDIHKAYIKAGAVLIRTNTFAANKQTLSKFGEEQKELIKNAYGLAQRAVKEAKAEGFTNAQDIYIACDIGPIPENGTRTEEDILAEYLEMCDAFLEAGGEVFLFETFSDFYYLKNVTAYIKKKKPEAFIITNFCLNKNGFTTKGISARTILETIEKMEEIEAGGFNCGIGSGHMNQILKRLPFPEKKFIAAMPNAGYPEQFKNRLVFMDNEGYFRENLQRICDLGVDIIGGCCGTTPDYIQNMSERLLLREDYRGVRKDLAELKESKVEVRTNDFYELFKTNKKVVAVELDPPFDAKDEKVIACALKLKETGTDIITIADSPMGRSRVDSILMALKLHNETGLPVMPHVCCRDKNMISMRSTLLGAYLGGIRNILIVTGDPIPSEHRQSTTGVFDYNSIQLMNYVKEMNREHFPEELLYYGGALNYGRGPIEKVVERMEKKIEAGAGYFLTQPVYSEEDMRRLEEIKKRVNTRILCGIMPLVSYTNANFIKNEISGINVPDWVVERYRPDMEKEEAEWVAADIASEIIRDISPFADGYYFMLPFNRVSLMEKIKIV